MAEHIPIFLASDDNYVSYLAVTIASVCYNTKSFVDFYILDNGISDFNKKQLEILRRNFSDFTLEYLPVNENSLLENIEYKNKSKYITKATYSRFLIPEFKPELSKIVYLDVDIILLDDIEKLWQKELDGYALGACPGSSILAKIAIGSARSHQYFNAGVLLLDIQQWRENHIMEKLFNIEKKYRQRLLLADQDVLNIFFEDNYKQLSMQYNSMTTVMTDEDDLYKNIIIRHFNGEQKPWNTHKYKGKELRHFNEFWFFASLTPFYTGFQRAFLSCFSFQW
jgi:lipopolysaccharide biosynthesis glycosyltransferase